MGKPDPVIYKVALQMLQLPKEKVIAIGDSLQHDIQGTNKTCLCLPCLTDLGCHLSMPVTNALTLQTVPVNSSSMLSAQILQKAFETEARGRSVTVHLVAEPSLVCA